MTNCKHCGLEIVKYSRGDVDWENIGDDDQWVHMSPHGAHVAEPEWKDEK